MYVFDLASNLYWSNLLGPGNPVLNCKPYIGLYVVSGAISTTNVTGTATGVTLSARTANTLYQINFPTHPAGSNYMVFAQARTGSSGTAAFMCTTNVTGSTSLNVWCRSYANALQDGDFFVFTVP